MTSHARRLVLIPLIALVAAALAGCNTVKGVGKDIQAGAEATERAIDDARKD
jgi:entericidin B